MPDIVTLLELELGVRVFVRKLDSRISGLFVYDETLGPCMLLNANHPRERRVQTAGHETGHFISSRRWQDLHTAGTDTTVVFRPVDPRFQGFVRRVTVVFHPDESGQDRGLEDLSDGTLPVPYGYFGVLACDFHPFFYCFYRGSPEGFRQGAYQIGRNQRVFADGFAGDIACQAV
jgi:hypothetical protein